MKVKSKDQVFSQLRQHQKELQEFGVQRCGVFGSFVRNQGITEESDVDILVIFEPGQKSFDNFMSLCFYLETIFNRRVDLVTIESLGPYIGPHIISETEYVTINP